MKSGITLSLVLTGLILLVFAWTPCQIALADNPATPAVASGQMEALFAQSDSGAGGSPHQTDIYIQLKKLIKDYRNANTPDLKKGIADRSEELMGQLFDAKVQSQQARIETLEKKLNDERERLKDMQLHKVDLVHKAVQKALVSQGREWPKWAIPPK